MLELITDLPDNAVGFSAKGKVTGEDYENVLIPAVEEKLRSHRKLCLLYHLGNEWEGFDAAAIWDDTRVGLRHLMAWDKVAVVTDSDLVRATSKTFGFVLPCNVRVFSNEQLVEAKEWLRASADSPADTAGADAPAEADHTTNSAFYDRISRAYDLIADSSEHTYRQEGIAALELEPGATVLEVGFGTGNGLLELAEAVTARGHVHGIDISTGMREVADEKIRKRGLSDRIETRVASARELPFDDAAFDAVFMSFTLELFPDDEIPLVLEEIRRVLKAGGRLGVVGLATPPEGEHESLMTKGYQWMHRHFPHVADCRPIDISRCVRDAGFDVTTDRRKSMWSMPVGIVVGVKRQSPDSEDR